MLTSTKQKFTLFALLLSFYSCAWIIQTKLLIKGDVIWLFYLADKVLHGGKYLQDFFEINPPLSIYIYVPAVLISKIFSLSPIHSARSYVFGLSLCSLFLCYLQINRIFSKNEALGGLGFLLSIVFVFIILPMSEFGQRENLLVILTLPYFLSLVCHLKKKPVSTGCAILIGLMAGIGFAIKPFYIISLSFVESYYLFSSKKVRHLLRPETITMAMVTLFYLLVVVYFNPDYLYSVVPVAAKFYYISFASSLRYLIISPIFYYSLLALGLYAVQYKTLGKDQALVCILLLAMSGFMGGYLLQRIPWYYHVYPAFALTILYFTAMFYVLEKNLQLQTTKSLSALFYCKTPFLIGVALVFFSFPGYFLIQFFKIGYAQKNGLNGLIQLLHTNKEKKSLYFFSSFSAYMVSVFEHADVKHASRLQFLAWMRYYYNCSPAEQAKHKSTYQKVNDLFINWLAVDINKNKPDWILVDEQSYFGPRGKMSINYLAYLEKNPSFQSAWSAYHYIGTVKNSSVPYEFKIYSRTN